MGMGKDPEPTSAFTFAVVNDRLEFSEQEYKNLVDDTHGMNTSGMDSPKVSLQSFKFKTPLFQIATIIRSPEMLGVWRHDNVADVAVAAVSAAVVLSQGLGSDVELDQAPTVSSHQEIFAVWSGSHSVDESLMDLAVVLDHIAVLDAKLSHVTVLVGGEKVIGVSGNADREDRSLVGLAKVSDKGEVAQVELLEVTLRPGDEESARIRANSAGEHGSWEDLAVIFHQLVGLDVELLQVTVFVTDKQVS